MTTRTHTAFLAIALATLFIPTAFASAATALLQNLSNASPLAKTSVTFNVAVAGFTVPIFQLTDSFPNSSINSGNINFGGNFQWVPNVSDIGSHTLTIRVTDSEGSSAIVTQTINVLPPPSISIQSVSATGAIMPGTPFTFSVVAPGFSNPSFSVSDSFSGTGASTVVSSSINSSGNFSWTPDASQNGDHAITVFASDTQGHNAQATAVIRVGSGPTLSLPGNVPSTLALGQPLNFTLIPTGFTPTGYMVSDSFSGQSTLTSNNVNTSGLVYWSPSGTDAGTHKVTITGQVGSYGQKASTTLTINVLGANGVLPVTPTAPVASTDSSVSALQNQLAALQAQIGGATKPTITTPAGTGFIFTLYLKQGSENDEVLELQKVLKNLGYLTVAPNGYFGPSTVAAVKKFQAAKGLDQLGAVGPGTRLELNSLAPTQVTTPTTSTASNSSYVFEHFMGVGDDDPDVLELQKRLVSLGFMTAAPTGYYGAGTEAAVKKFQTKRGLPPTGYVAKITRAELNK